MASPDDVRNRVDALKKAGATTERYGATLNVAADSLQGVAQRSVDAPTGEGPPAQLAVSS